MTERSRYLLIWFDVSTPIGPGALVPIRRAIEDTVKEPRADVEVDVWLESAGGDAHTAYKLALILRHVAGHVRVVIPDYAKSAATLLALVGDEIFLGPGAELGPLDGQIPEEGSLSGYMSALNIARAADEVARDAISLAGSGGAMLFNTTGLTRAHTLEAMLRFSANFCEPLVRQLDPRLVHNAKQTLRVTTRYAERLLARTVPENNKQVAASLVENFPTHGFVIDFAEASQMGLPVKPLDEYDLLEQVRNLHRYAEDRYSEDGARIVDFRSVRELADEQEEGESREARDRGLESGPEGQVNNDVG